MSKASTKVSMASKGSTNGAIKPGPTRGSFKSTTASQSKEGTKYSRTNPQSPEQDHPHGNPTIQVNGEPADDNMIDGPSTSKTTETEVKEQNAQKYEEYGPDEDERLYNFQIEHVTKMALYREKENTDYYMTPKTIDIPTLEEEEKHEDVPIPPKLNRKLGRSMRAIPRGEIKKLLDLVRQSQSSRVAS